MSLTDKQREELDKKLDPKHVKQRPDSGMSYVEAWHVIAEANRIFGHAEWSSETIELTENTPPTQNNKSNNVVSFRAKVRIQVNGATREGIGFGSGIAKDIHAAYEGAIKEAESDARKRALMTFGNPFGLALYDKTQANVGVEANPLQEVAARIKDQLKAADNPEVIEYVWKGFENDLAEIKKASPDKAYPALEKLYGERLAATAQAPVNGAVQ